MSQINQIKDLSNCGYRITEISRETGADIKTIRKYLLQEDFSPLPPVITQKPSKPDPYKPIIKEWLEEDKKHWHKQHHTAQRIYERLAEEHGYSGGYSVAQRYLKTAVPSRHKSPPGTDLGSGTCTGGFWRGRFLRSRQPDPEKIFHLSSLK